MLNRELKVKSTAPRLLQTPIAGLRVADGLRCACGALVRPYPRSGADGDFELLCENHHTAIEKSAT